MTCTATFSGKAGRPVYFGTNTKMYKTIAQTSDVLTELDRLTAGLSRERLTLFVIPSFTALERARRCAPPERILLGAQNMGWADEGQFTGEISPLMLREVGVQVVEIGHSERRHVLGETDWMENQKVRCALRHAFTPLLCIGETAEQKEMGLSDEVLRTQLKAGLQGVTAAEAARLWVAYEPVWAIGTAGVPASPDYAEEKHRVIRQCLTEQFGAVGGAIPLLYGGSVNRENAVQLIPRPNIDGLFIGRSAWEAERFAQIIRDCLAVLSAV